MRRRLTRLLWALVLTALALAAVSKFLVAPFVVVGDSMAPTLQSLDLCLMQRVRHYQPARGDIVMFRTADDPPLFFVKRVVALPGETIAIADGVVKINGARLDEPYAPPHPGLELPLTNVPPGKVYVIGDNRSGSLSTLVATRLITGRLVGHWRWKK